MGRNAESVTLSNQRNAHQSEYNEIIQLQQQNQIRVRTNAKPAIQTRYTDQKWQTGGDHAVATSEPTGKKASNEINKLCINRFGSRAAFAGFYLFR